MPVSLPPLSIVKTNGSVTHESVVAVVDGAADPRCAGLRKKRLRKYLFEILPLALTTSGELCGQNLQHLANILATTVGTMLPNLTVTFAE